MGKTVNTEITCDACGRDLLTTGYECEYRLELVDVQMGHSEGAVFSMGLWPHLDGTKAFCNVRCLVSWVQSSTGRDEGPVPEDEPF